MGTYFNPSNEGFRKSAKDEIYIDKSGLLNILNRRLGAEKNCIAVSHARRFGKSQAARMIDAYYSRGCDSTELFSNLEISKSPDFKKHLNQYNVIHIDISSFTDYYKENLVSKIIEIIYNELKAEYPDIMDIDNPFATILKQVYDKTEVFIEGKSAKYPFVIIIDEWDCVIRDFSDRPEIVHEYLQFLHSLFKSEESQKFLALGYITGILPVKKIKKESALNNFREYTMADSKEFTPYFGFTEKETEELCRRYDMNFDSVKAWYNGYLISGQHMYNPNSVYQAMVDHSLESYWKNTSAFDTINTYITMDFDGLKDDVITMLNGGKVRVDVNTFRNDLSEINSKDDAVTALIHLGYLGYNSDRKSAYIPNYEVATAFQSALATGNWSEIAKTMSRCDELLWATIDREETRVAELIELSHETYTSVLKYNDENSLSCAITMAYFTAPAYYTVIRELPSGKGFADIVFIPRADSNGKPAMVIELKWDKNADTAIKQIKENRYAGKLKGYGNEILLVGINYDKDSKKHECVIESVEGMM
ncbi:MAG: AAA family ATPase [Oscillospiraceae bacterium]|nr:AAA family ATPase [Oscillospiraceae bacterium]